MIVAVTGGHGFIGRHLVTQLLAEGHKVRLLSRAERVSPEVAVFCGRLGYDPAERLVPFLEGADALVHCAGEVSDSAAMEATHVTGTRDLLAAASGRVSHWVQLSSVGVYGPVAAGVVTEESPIRPVGTYETTKAASDKLVLNAIAQNGMTGTILRPSIVFGEDMANSSLRQLARMIRRDQFFFVGPPGASANYVHVDHVVDALTFCLVAPAARNCIFNLSDWTTMEGFTRALAEGLGCSPPRRRLPKSLVHFAARLGGKLPRFPLTRSRVNALTGRARYPIGRLRQAGFELSRALEADATTVAAAWRTAL